MDRSDGRADCFVVRHLLAVAAVVRLGGGASADHPGSHLDEAAKFFIYDTPKVLMLLTLVVFGMGVVRSFFSPERTRAMLAGKREGIGNVAAAALGVFTPFCSCSAVPLFVGFVSAGVPLGVTFSFLIAAPMVNEVALGLLFALVGWKVALTYLAFGLTLAIVSGWVIGRLHLEGWLEEWVRNVRAGKADSPSNRPPSSTASRPGSRRCATSSGRSGCGLSSESPPAHSFTATCRTTFSPRSWAGAHGGRCRPSC